MPTPKELKEEKERLRLFEMTKFERELAEKGYKLIAGADEVGRGPLAGAVVACVVILPQGFTYNGVNDSKKVSEKNRILLDEIIRENAVSFAIGEASEREIEDINILNATKLAMVRAYQKLSVKPDFLLVDALELPDIKAPQQSIIKGDANVFSIAAASIVAKVYRDKYMESLHEQYPEYGFNKNKGYGTAAHITAIKKYGACEAHRKTFITKFV